jgi:Fic family protein
VAEELLDRIRREIGERLAASRSAYEESTRLEAALAALEGERGPVSQTRRAPSRRAARERAPVRAPRGENRRRILAAVEQHPGANARELADATGIPRATVATTLTKLVADGELAKSGGRKQGMRYRWPEPASPAPYEESADDPAAAADRNG